MSKAFDKIAAGLTDAIAYAGGDTSKGRVAAGPDVKAIRAKTKLSQTKFADKLRCWGWSMLIRRWRWS
jgi:putative transcriptional regulator